MAARRASPAAAVQRHDDRERTATRVGHGHGICSCAALHLHRAFYPVGGVGGGGKQRRNTKKGGQQDPTEAQHGGKLLEFLTLVPT